MTLLILASGFFYFEEQKKGLIEQEHFSMLEYARLLKTNTFVEEEKHISHEIQEIEISEFSINNFSIEKEYFIKYVPYTWKSGFIKIKKYKCEYNEALFYIKRDVITVQLFLLLLFAVLSYFLSRRALAPMQEAITKLDNFSKDLIHDLNTPITSISLNIKLLQKSVDFQTNKPLNRIKRSIDDILELHNNLSILLQEETFLIQNESLAEIINEVVLNYKKIYPQLRYEVDVVDFYVNINKKAFKQVLVNLLSNASKYNKKNGFIKIYVQEKMLCIQDSGVGIKNTKNIFERSYKEQTSGHGIGLDIVKRLCEAMSIRIFAHSEIKKGTIIYLKF